MGLPGNLYCYARALTVHAFLCLGTLPSCSASDGVRRGGAQVMETFNKIGVASTTHIGLETLYNLLEEHPTFPVEDLLSRTSEPFLNYIDKGLHKVRSPPCTCTRHPGCGPNPVAGASHG